jgi:hypothetical protein
VPLNADGTLAGVYIAAAGNTTDLVIDVTGAFTTGSGGASYNALNPVRVLDSRSGVGLKGDFRAGVPRVLQVAGVGAIPDDAVAVTLNVTVVGQTAAGYVSLTPAADSTPATSTLNFPTDDVRANGVTVPLNADGTLAGVYIAAAGNTTDLVIDVTGAWH